jgi:hypothetical protein
MCIYLFIVFSKINLNFANIQSHITTYSPSAKLSWCKTVFGPPQDKFATVSCGFVHVGRPLT